MSNKDLNVFSDELINKIKDANFIMSSDIPNIDLYMDQLTTFMQDNLGLFKRNEDEKILTKTMINNYSKAKLIPPSNKKKYSNDHIVLLLFIYYFKGVLSIPDIKNILSSIYPENTDEYSIKDLLDKIMIEQSKQFELFSNQIKNTVNIAGDMFSDIEDDNIRKKLEIFSSIYLFSLQATTFKHIATSIIDEYLVERNNNKLKKKRKR